jgi:hypothetical protein
LKFLQDNVRYALQNISIDNYFLNTTKCPGNKRRIAKNKTASNLKVSAHQKKQLPESRMGEKSLAAIH